MTAKRRLQRFFGLLILPLCTVLAAFLIQSGAPDPPLSLLGMAAALGLLMLLESYRV